MKVTFLISLFAFKMSVLIKASRRFTGGQRNLLPPMVAGPPSTHLWERGPTLGGMLPPQSKTLVRFCKNRLAGCLLPTPRQHGLRTVFAETLHRTEGEVRTPPDPVQPGSLSASHTAVSVPATWASLPFLDDAKLPSAPGPFHLLFLLPGTLLPLHRSSGLHKSPVPREAFF